MRRNVEVNALASLVSVREVAVGGADGVADFTTGLGARNHVAVDQSEGLRQVPMTTLDTAGTDSRPALLKIDVEGYNRQVVAGARATLASETLKAIIIEWPSEVIDVLAASGFRRVHYDPGERRYDDGPVREDEPNALFIRDPRFVEERVAGGRRFRVCGMDN